ncbi:MAG: ParB/RepB/Spo0J family partition protein [Polyangiaceae bacterium]|nr:ParB/RepB/Spo0J family partition protein [Polyangiaceae bacterium]
MSDVRRALGRGLDALLPAAPTRPAESASGSTNVFPCALEKIVPQKGQPRQRFEKGAIEELAQSIRDHGLIEPLVVRRIGTSDKFELIAGERRWRAAQKAGLREVLVVVKDVSPQDAFELAIVENIQREDLNSIELAEAFDRLIREHDYTHELLAEKLHKDRVSITNTLRLLKLPTKAREKVISGDITEGHARAILGAGDQMVQLLERVLAEKLSVRATEEWARKLGQPKKKKGAKAAAEKSVAVKDLERRLSQKLGLAVEVRDKGNKGEVVFLYRDLDALDRILAKLL